MTREEALCRVKGYLTDIIPTESYSEVEEIIKALEQEPCDDAISRQAVLDLVNSDWKYENLELDIVNLPPVTPQPKYEDIAKAFQIGLAFGFGEKHDEMGKVIEEVKKAIEPKPKTGRWIYDYIAADGHRTYHCSECGCYLKPKHSEPLNSFKWCSSCGAKMQESEEV